jgi:hypothetical protein
MNNERGSAIVMVLIFLGVMGIIGAGLLLQTQVDTQFTSAVQWSDSRAGLGDMGASTQFQAMPKNPGDTGMPGYTGNPMIGSKCTDCPKAEKRTGITASNNYSGATGTYDYRSILIGDAPKAECPGFPITQPMGGAYSGVISPFYWVAEGTGKAVRGGNPQATVDIACTKCR